MRSSPVRWELEQSTIPIHIHLAILGLGLYLGIGFAQAKTDTNPSPTKFRAALNHVGGSASGGFYDATRGRWRWEGPVIVGSTAIASYLLYEFADYRVRGANQRTWGGASDWISTTGGYAPFAAPILFFGAGALMEEGSSQRAYTMDTAEILAESVAYTFATTMALKYSVGRERPAYQDRRSFPSGHSSLAFAAAGTLMYRYPWYVGAFSMTLASAIAFTRVDQNVHFTSDVVAGAGIGMLFATATHLYHKQRRDFSHASLGDSNPNQKMIYPLIAQDTYGLGFGVDF